MRQIRIYQPGHYGPGDTITLSPSASHHVAVVLRLRPGDPLVVFPGNGQDYTATLTSAHKKYTQVSVLDKRVIHRESPCTLHLVQAIAKGERMEWVIQKAVELGVTHITPLQTEHGAVRLDEVRMAKKMAQWEAIIVAAAEQSGRAILPTLHPITPLKTYLASCNANRTFLLNPEANTTWRDIANPGHNIALLIGPEGGFSPEEVRLAAHHGVESLSLGPRILRTETAALAALTLLQALGGDL